MSKIFWVNMEFDEEWAELIMKARKMGLSIEEIRQFFQDRKSEPSEDWYQENEKIANLQRYQV